MSTSSGSYLAGLDLARSAAMGFGCLGLAVGLRGLVQPREFAATFGLPQSLSAPENPWIQVTAGRNVANAIALLILSQQNDRRAMGFCLVSGVVTGLTDAVVCYRYGKKDVGISHGVTAAIFTGFGTYLLLSA